MEGQVPDPLGSAGVPWGKGVGLMGEEQECDTPSAQGGASGDATWQ